MGSKTGVSVSPSFGMPSVGDFFGCDVRMILSAAAMLAANGALGVSHWFCFNAGQLPIHADDACVLFASPSPASLSRRFILPLASPVALPRRTIP